ncbi:hypothetical protein GCM10027408_23790 [Microbacterium tumbae]
MHAGELGRTEAGDPELAVLVAKSGCRPHPLRQIVRVLGHGEPFRSGGIGMVEHRRTNRGSGSSGEETHGEAAPILWQPVDPVRHGVGPLAAATGSGRTHATPCPVPSAVA